MNVREELNAYRKNVQKIENLHDEINEIIENRYDSASGGVNTSGIFAKGYKQSVEENNFIRIEMKIEKLKYEIHKIERKLTKIDKLIALLNEEQRKIIVDFFLFNKSNRKIANDLGVEIEAIKKRKKRIIKKMQKMYDNSKFF